MNHCKVISCQKPIEDWKEYCTPHYIEVMRKARPAGKKALAECKAMLVPEEVEKKESKLSPWKCEHVFISGLCECGTFEDQFWYSIKAPLDFKHIVN